MNAVAVVYLEIIVRSIVRLNVVYAINQKNAVFVDGEFSPNQVCWDGDIAELLNRDEC